MDNRRHSSFHQLRSPPFPSNLTSFQEMQGRTNTNTSQPGSPDRPFKGVNSFAISVSQKNRNPKSSGFQSIDDIGTPSSSRRSNTFPQHQGKTDISLSGNPQAASAATPTSLYLNNYGKHTTIVIREYSDSHPTGDRQDVEAQVNQGHTIPHLQDVRHTNTGNPPHIPEDFRTRDRVRTFATETLPRLIYLHLLLRLPYLYFSRVDKIFWGAELSMEEIKEMALRDGSADILTVQYQVGNCFFVEGAEEQPPAYLRLKVRWEELIDTLMEEWKTLNIISVLLLGAIMTMFQIDGAAQDPITRYLAFCSLICALISLLHGCMFIVRFSTMRKGYRAAEWALEAQKYLNAFWNVWVMLSMPLVWLTWSIITFIIGIMTFVWRSRAALPEDFVFSVSSWTEIGAKIFISIVLGNGVLYTVLIIQTLRRYGTRMDVAWRERINKYIEGLKREPTSPAPPDYVSDAHTREPLPIRSPTEMSIRGTTGEAAAKLGVVAEDSAWIELDDRDTRTQRPSVHGTT